MSFRAKVNLSIVLVIVFFGFCFPGICRAESETLQLKATVTLTPEFINLVSANSTVGFIDNDDTKVVLHLRGNQKTKMIGHLIRMLFDSGTELLATSDANSVATFDTKDLVPGRYKVSFEDLYYPSPITIKNNMTITIRAKNDFLSPVIGKLFPLLLFWYPN